MTRTENPRDRGRIVGMAVLSAAVLALSACAGDPEPAPPVSVEVIEPTATGETIRSALGKITLEAASEGQDVLGVQVAGDRGLVNLHYAGPAERYVVCDAAGWLVPGGGVIDINLSENAAFETIDDKGNPVSIERWVRLDALTNIVVQDGQQDLDVQPRTRYIVSMVTEVYNLNERIGHKAERLEFESGGSAVTSTGHRCESSGVLERLAGTAIS
ncbi:MAG: hypothetical protein AAGA21_18830 [Pseudomonadota bacterium]